MPQIVQARPSRRKPILLAVGMVMAVVLVAGLVWWLHLPTPAAVVQQADNLNAQGRYAEAYAKLKSAYGRALTNNDKSLVVSRLAATRYSQGKLDEALQYYQELDRRQPHTLSTLESLGEVADQLGRRDVALSAYKQAIDLLNQSQKGVRTDAELERLKGRVAELEQS